MSNNQMEDLILEAGSQDIYQSTISIEETDNYNKTKKSTMSLSKIKAMPTQKTKE
jgi:hypothetical protein